MKPPLEFTGGIALSFIGWIEMTYPLAELTWAAEIDNLDCRSLGVAEEDVLRLEVAVDDVEFGRGEEQQRRAQLLSELAGEIQRDASEVGVAQ